MDDEGRDEEGPCGLPDGDGEAGSEEEAADRGVKGGQTGAVVRLFDEGGFRLTPPAEGFVLPPLRRFPEVLVPENLVARRIWAGRIAAIQKYGEEKARKLYTVLWVSDEEWDRLVYAASKITVKRLP